MILDHIGELPEVREYRGAHRFVTKGSTFVLNELADAAIAAADRGVGRLEWMLNDACEELAARAGSQDWSGCSAKEMRESLESRWTRRETP